MHRHATSYRVLTGTLFLVAVTALAGACDDPNFFGTTQEPPEITELTPDPTTVAEGDTLVYAISASGNRNIERIRVLLTGALSRDTTFSVDEPGTSIEGTMTMVVPGGTEDPTLTAEAWVIDVADDTSESVTATVTVEDGTPPTVSASPSPSQVGSGDVIQIAVNAADARGLAEVSVEVTDGLDYDTTLVETVSGSPTSYSETWQLVAPDVQIGTLTFTPSAVDINALSGTGDEASIEIGDRAGPIFVALSTVPDSTIPLGDSLQVIATIEDPAGISSVTMIGLSKRGDPSMGTDSVVERFAQKTITFPRPTEADTLPQVYTVDPYILPTDNETTEPVEIFVVAEDALGNVSDTTKFMYVGGPAVEIAYPPEGFTVGVGSDFNVQVAVDDGTGVDSAQLILGGAMNGTYTLALPPRTDTPFVAVQNVTMPGAEGVVTLQAVAWNTAEVQGQSRLAEVSVLAAPPTDTVPPLVSVTAERFVPQASAPRMELLDEIRVTVSAFDGNSGVERIGLTMVANRGTQSDTVTEELTGLGGSNDLEKLTFQVPVDSLYGLFGITDPAVLDSILPENIDLRIHGFAADAEDQFACSVGAEEQRSCSPAGAYDPTAFYEVADHSGLPLRVEAVRGVTVLLDNTEAVIGDLAIDTVDDRLFLSNVTDNLVEFLQLDVDPRDNAFQAPVQVGSEPLGLFLGERVVSNSELGFGGITVTAGDTLPTLLVANSGGTNVSLVHMDANAANVQEVDVIRLRTPNAVLFQIEENTDDSGNIQYTVEWIYLADRPQFLAQDSLLRMVYSTRATAATDITTVRFIHADPDPLSNTDQPEVRFMLTDAMVDPDQETSLVLANVDSIDVRALAGGADQVRVFMHKPGYPDQVIYNDPYLPQIEDALDSLVFQIDTIMDNRGIPNQAPMFYPFLMRGTWDFEALSWGDTTFVSASGDRGRIALGEGATSPVGRIMLWHADERATYSDAIQMTDLVNNAAEVVLGVGLNRNGSLGVARGNEATYFFTPDLRLQGHYAQEQLGGAGAAFHPEHDEVDDGQHVSGDGHGAAFTGTSEHSIDVVNTFHFNQITNLVIRDNIVGPLRAGPPLATDNVGLTCPTDLDCVVVKLYGITSAGGVVIVNVRRRDLEPYATP
ncbi:MAG: hypothetical protein R6U63_10050 [Longimicrobiales bacterium]